MATAKQWLTLIIGLSYLTTRQRAVSLPRFQFIIVGRVRFASNEGPTTSAVRQYHCSYSPNSLQKIKQCLARAAAHMGHKIRQLSYSDQSPSRARGRRPGHRVASGGQAFSCVAAARAACVSTWLGEAIVCSVASFNKDYGDRASNRCCARRAMRSAHLVTPGLGTVPLVDCLGTSGFVVKTTTIGGKRRKEPCSPVILGQVTSLGVHSGAIQAECSLVGLKSAAREGLWLDENRESTLASQNYGRRYAYVRHPFFN